MRSRIGYHQDLPTGTSAGRLQLAGPAAVWIAGYSNDVMAYIPSKRVREEGGYEGETAMRFSYTHPGPWSASLEERIVAEVHALDQALRVEVK